MGKQTCKHLIYFSARLRFMLQLFFFKSNIARSALGFYWQSALGLVWVEADLDLVEMLMVEV